MGLRYSPYALTLYITAALTLGLALYVLRKRQPEERVTFGLMMLAAAWWTFFYGLSISGTNIQTQLFFNRIKYVGIMAASPLWLILALQYTREKPVPRRTMILLFLPEVFFLLVALTDGWTHLWWPEVGSSSYRGYLVLERTHSLFYYAHTLLSYVYNLLGAWLYVRFYATAQSFYRSQGLVMLAASLVLVFANVLTQLGLSPLPWGLDAFVFSLSGWLMAVAIFYYRFLDLVPIARRAVVEQIPDGMLVVDGERRVVDANRAAQVILDVPFGRLIGASLSSIVRSESLLAEIEGMMAEEAHGKLECDVNLNLPDKEQVLCVHVTKLGGGRGRPLGWTIILQDITDRIAVRRELERLYQQAEQERERLALIIGTARDAIVLLGEKYEILAMNPAAREILPPAYDVFPDDLREWLGDVSPDTGVTITEVELDDQVFNVTAAPVSGTGLVFTMHDITHLKELSYLKDQFVATVSHDLRSPLTSIIGYANLVRHGSLKEAEKDRALGRVEAAAQRMTDLINDLLDLAKIEAGVEMELEPVALHEVAEEAIAFLEGAALEKELEIVPELEPVPAVLADPTLVFQVWQNLISNAIKYTPAGKVRVRTRHGDGHVEGVVEDTGLGIPAPDLPFIFDKFYRVQNRSNLHVRGTGLGLAMVKTIVERHGGRVVVRSSLNEGSTFTFQLPLNVPSGRLTAEQDGTARSS